MTLASRPSGRYAESSKAHGSSFSGAGSFSHRSRLTLSSSPLSRAGNSGESSSIGELSPCAKGDSPSRRRGNRPGWLNTRPGNHDSSSSAGAGDSAATSSIDDLTLPQVPPDAGGRQGDKEKGRQGEFSGGSAAVTT